MEDVLKKLKRVMHYNTLKHTATHRNSQQHPGALGDGGCAGETEQGDTLQYTAKICNKMQHPATPRSVGRWRM